MRLPKFGTILAISVDDIICLKLKGKVSLPEADLLFSPSLSSDRKQLLLLALIVQHNSLIFNQRLTQSAKVLNRSSLRTTPPQACDGDVKS